MWWGVSEFGRLLVFVLWWVFFVLVFFQVFLLVWGLFCWGFWFFYIKYCVHSPVSTCLIFSELHSVSQN